MGLVIVTTVLIVIFYFCFKQRNESKYIDDFDTEIDESVNIPLMSRYNISVNNEKADKIISILKDINFWVAIIGTYYLFKIIFAVIRVIIAIKMGAELMELFNAIF